MNEAEQNRCQRRTAPASTTQVKGGQFMPTGNVSIDPPLEKDRTGYANSLGHGQVCSLRSLLLTSPLKGYTLGSTPLIGQRAREKPKMSFEARTRNVQRGEAILRIVIGAICLVLALFVPGSLRWFLGLAGLAFLLTAFFGY